MYDQLELEGTISNVATESEFMALRNAHKRPAMTTLVEEFSEATLSARGKHEDPLELELMQIASVCVNLISQIRLGDEARVKNIGGKVENG